MTVSTEDARGDAARSAEPRRAGRELLLGGVFRPPSRLVASALARAGVAPPAVVLANAAAGLLAAFALARGELVAAAILLQLKTLLDNADGELARLTGRITLVGRYLDTEADLVVNAAVFVALGHVTGQPVLAAAAFVALTLVLAVDFNATQLYRETRGQARSFPHHTGGRSERLLEGAYAVVFARLDRLVRWISQRRFARAVASEGSREGIEGARRAYVDGFTVTVLANLGLTTQLAVLGLCLVVGVPELYLWLVLACLAGLVPLQARAEARARGAQYAPRKVSR